MHCLMKTLYRSAMAFSFFSWLFIGPSLSAGPAFTSQPIQPEAIATFGFVQCTNIVDPFNGQTNVPVTASISWDVAVGNPDAYLLTIGTSPGGSEIFDGDVGNVTTFDPPGDLPANTTIYVTVIGYNANGPATGCDEESFTTEAAGSAPGCTGLTNPPDGATGVATTASLTWDAAAGSPTGYRLDVGISPGGSEILDNFDAGNVTTLDPPGVFPNNVLIYVHITPYNAIGDAAGCPEESFTTEFCTPNLLVVSNPVPSGTYWSIGDLVSNNSTVADGSVVVFKSDTGVLLEQDFTVELGADFEAKIEGCE